MSLSTTEAEYVAAASCCAQLLWMRQTLLDFGITCESVSLLCDNESAMKIVLNPMQHTTGKQLADIFMKLLDEARLCELRCELSIIRFK